MSEIKSDYYKSLTWEAQKQAEAAKINRQNHNQLGKNEFMQLLITQLQHQDPLQPQDNTAYIAQLAQFSSLEGIQNLNQSVGKFGTTLRSTQALQASALVGRKISIETDAAKLGANKTIDGSFAIDESLKNVSLRILNSGGSIVREINLGDRLAGSHQIHWDGKDLNGNDARVGDVYTVQVIGTKTDPNTANNVAVYAPTTLTVNIDSVSLGKAEEGSKILLNIAGVQGGLPIEYVKEFH